MTKSELIERVAERAELTRGAAARAVEAIFDTASGAISEAVHSAGSFSLPGFGRFAKKTRPAGKRRHPRDGVVIDVPERSTVTFRPGRGLRAAEPSLVTARAPVQRTRRSATPQSNWRALPQSGRIEHSTAGFRRYCTDLAGRRDAASGGSLPRWGAAAPLAAAIRHAHRPTAYDPILSIRTVAGASPGRRRRCGRPRRSL